MTQQIFSGAPLPVSGVTGGPGLPQGVASVDGTTGNVQISPPSNTIQQKKGASPQSLQVYEFDGGPTSFARLALNAQTGGPFQLAVEVQPPGTIRALQINSNSSITLNCTAVSVPSASIGAQAFGGNTAFGTNFGIRPNFPGSFLYSGSGVPSNTQGNDGDFYFRTDGITSLTAIYMRRAGAWVGIV